MKADEYFRAVLQLRFSGHRELLVIEGAEYNRCISKREA
jgi:hypothetical protein